tara:strand:- start:2865 stop:3566 length:702 start_codon:yes stop_codon:yes gene_type:complete
MRIDNPTIQGDITLPATSSGHFSGSFEGDGGQLTNVAPIGGTNISVVGTTVNLDDDVTLTGTITAATGTFVHQIFESSSTIISSGSNIFGDTEADNQIFTGSILQTGSITTNGIGVGTAPSGVVGAILATNDVVAFASSDERLKENVASIENAVEKVEAIGGYTYNWIPMEGVHVYGDMKDVGVIAQEIEKVLPELVSDRENGYKAVKYDKLTAVLIEAVKELSERVKALEGK